MEPEVEIQLETRRLPKLFDSASSSDSPAASPAASVCASRDDERHDKKRVESKPISRDEYYRNMEWFYRNSARVHEDIIEMEVQHKWHLEEAKKLIPRIKKFRERLAEIDEARQAFKASHHVADN